MSDAVEVLAGTDRFEIALKGQTFGVTKVHDVHLIIDEDGNGGRALFIEVMLSDPIGETWPHGDIRDLRRRIVLAAREIP